MRRDFILWFAALAFGCSSSPQAIEGTQLRMEFGAVREFWAAPFPSEHRRTAEGRVALAGFPNPGRVELIETAKRLLESDSSGFGLTSAIYFQTSAPLDESRLSGEAIFLTAIDRESPDFGRSIPLSIRFLEDPGPFGAPNMLALLPVQGIPLREKTRYAAVVLRSLRDRDGAELGRSLAMAQLLAGEAPAGLSGTALQDYRDAIARLGELGDRLAASGELGDRPAPGGLSDQLAGIAVFRTGEPSVGMYELLEGALAEGVPAPVVPFVAREVFEDYCVFTSTIAMPDYQEGDPPFSSEGGAIRFDDGGRPILQRRADARFVVTIPRRPMPAAGYPAAVFIRTGGGGERPLVDRGVHAVAHGDAIEPGMGPAVHFARAGFAGVSVDGPHGGLRNVTHGDEQFLVINVFNPVALRDNLRQSAVELALLPHIFASLEIDSSSCPGAAPLARFDVGRLALMGHSMGATIAPLVLAAEPAYRALILSGAGGSWIENVVHKKSPVVVSGVAQIILGYSETGRAIVEHDPALTLIQWAGEAADPPVYGRAIIHEPRAGSMPRHVLMFQGIVDTYILPPIANATSLSLGLDLAAPGLETSLGEVLPLIQRSVIPLPVSGNLVEGAVTGVVVQHAQDEIEDGHEVVFQTEGPKHQYRCFLESFARGETPRVPAAAGVDAPCGSP